MFDHILKLSRSIRRTANNKIGFYRKSEDWRPRSVNTDFMQLCDFEDFERMFKDALYRRGIRNAAGKLHFNWDAIPTYPRTVPGVLIRLTEGAHTADVGRIDYPTIKYFLQEQRFPEDIPMWDSNRIHDDVYNVLHPILNILPSLPDNPDLEYSAIDKFLNSLDYDGRALPELKVLGCSEGVSYQIGYVQNTGRGTMDITVFGIPVDKMTAFRQLAEIGQ